jgi:hypothetical protein
MTTIDAQHTHLHERERGVALAWAGIFMLVFFGMAALAVDLSYMYLTDGELQDAADAAALAAVGALKEGKNRQQAIDEAVRVARLNHAGGKTVQLDPARDIVFGDYDSGVFQREGFNNASAVQVTARRTEESPGGPIELLFARIWGHTTGELQAEAVAALGKRDVVIVQDVTYSFLQEINDAKIADKRLVHSMSSSGIAGDRIGVVTFNEASKLITGFQQLPASNQSVQASINDFSYCTTSAASANCAGTHIAPGLNTATNLFRTSGRTDAERVIILVTDGMPYPSSRRGPAITAADAADAESINIFAVTLTQETSGSYGSGGADAAFNAGLVRGYGKAYQTPDSKQLDDILLQILEEMPVRLVK